MKRFLYLHKGTLHSSVWSQIEECNRKSCHILLQRKHPPLTLLLQVTKCLIESWSPWQVKNLLHGPLFLLGSMSYGPTLVHPSVHICSRQSMASLNCKYKLCSSLCLLVLFFLYQKQIRINISPCLSSFYKLNCLLW